MRSDLKSAASDLMPELTHDTFLNGRLTIRQLKSGYRFSIDSVILANLARLRADERVLDIGAGCGIISLILACRYPDIRIYGVEIQPDMAAVASGNIAENKLENRVFIINRDIRTVAPEDICGCVDVVVCNPPHFEANSGRVNPDPGVAIARHEIKMTLDDLICAARRLLEPNGRLVVFYPAGRTADIICQMRGAGIEPKKAVMIFSKPGENAIRIMVEGVKGGRRGMTWGAPLYIYTDAGRYSMAVQHMFGSLAETTV
jgi:tRNA1Val (adenine37-N6)-methyltransferase